MNDIAIVITVFDGYVDLWDDCINLIKKHWVDHPPIYVFTNEIIKKWDDVICVSVGKDAEWSRKAQCALNYVKEDYIILMLEDFYVGADIDNQQVKELCEFVNARKIKYVKLCDNNRIIRKKKRKIASDLPYEVIFADEEYAISLQTSLWNKDFLRSELGTENYNAWVFELNQVKKAKSNQHIILDYLADDPRNILNIKHGALQGKMLPRTVSYFNNIGEPLTTNRAVMSSKEYRRYFIKQIGKDITPKFAVRFVKRIANLFGYSFVEKKWS